MGGTRGGVAVVTDSASDLDPGSAGTIRVVPLSVSFGTESALDRVELTPEDFWDRVGSHPELPTTASPPPQAFLDAYRAAASDGRVGVVSVHVSGLLSRTVESARAAADEAPVPVRVVDSRSVSLGQGLVARAAAGAGADLGAAAAAAERAADRLEIFAMLDTVEFLQRGGRVGRAKALLADVLRIRPLLRLEGGEPTLIGRPRTRARAIAELLDRVEGPAEAAGVLHAGAPEADHVAAEVARRAGVEPIVSLIGAITGTHLGPRALGVALLRPEGH